VITNIFDLLYQSLNSCVSERKIDTMTAKPDSPGKKHSPKEKEKAVKGQEGEILDGAQDGDGVEILGIAMGHEEDGKSIICDASPVFLQITNIDGHSSLIKRIFEESKFDDVTPATLTLGDTTQKGSVLIFSEKSPQYISYVVEFAKCCDISKRAEYKVAFEDYSIGTIGQKKQKVPTPKKDTTPKKDAATIDKAAKEEKKFTVADAFNKISSALNDLKVTSTTDQNRLKNVEEKIEAICSAIIRKEVVIPEGYFEADFVVQKVKERLLGDIVSTRAHMAIDKLRSWMADAGDGAVFCLSKIHYDLSDEKTRVKKQFLQFRFDNDWYKKKTYTEYSPINMLSFVRQNPKKVKKMEDHFPSFESFDLSTLPGLYERSNSEKLMAEIIKHEKEDDMDWFTDAGGLAKIASELEYHGTPEFVLKCAAVNLEHDPDSNDQDDEEDDQEEGVLGNALHHDWGAPESGIVLTEGIKTSLSGNLRSIMERNGSRNLKISASLNGFQFQVAVEDSSGKLTSYSFTADPQIKILDRTDENVSGMDWGIDEFSGFNISQRRGKKKTRVRSNFDFNKENIDYIASRLSEVDKSDFGDISRLLQELESLIADGSAEAALNKAAEFLCQEVNDACPVVGAPQWSLYDSFLESSTAAQRSAIEVLYLFRAVFGRKLARAGRSEGLKDLIGRVTKDNKLPTDIDYWLPMVSPGMAFNSISKLLESRTGPPVLQGQESYFLKGRLFTVVDSSKLSDEALIRSVELEAGMLNNWGKRDPGTNSDLTARVARDHVERRKFLAESRKLDKKLQKCVSTPFSEMLTQHLADLRSSKAYFGDNSAGAKGGKPELDGF
jgi:hypothetical protein